MHDDSDGVDRIRRDRLPHHLNRPLLLEDLNLRVLCADLRLSVRDGVDVIGC